MNPSVNDTVLLALLGLLGTMIGVVVWLIRLNANRAFEAQKVLTETLTKTIDNQREQIVTYGAGFTQLTETMRAGFTAVGTGRDEAVRKILEEDSKILKELDAHTHALDALVSSQVQKSAVIA